MPPCATQTAVVGSDSWVPATYSPDNTQAVQVAAPNALRRSVLIVCDAGSAGACHITDKQTASLSVGGRSYPLAVGEGVTINTTAAVYVIADTAGGATVKVIEEFGSNG